MCFRSSSGLGRVELLRRTDYITLGTEVARGFGEF